jgi:Family of unknown function (DUF5343)
VQAAEGDPTVAEDASSKVPYLQAYGNIKKALDKITTAAVPPMFTQDFLATTLNLPGGGARPVIPYLKRAGFLMSDGTPTDLYKQFRNPSLRGAAAAKATRNAYGSSTPRMSTSTTQARRTLRVSSSK